MRSHRRDFLKTALSTSTLISMNAATVPAFLGASARAARQSPSNERILVVVQLLGGNDGLNTVIPHKLDGYARNRRALRITGSEIVSITPEIGLHPAMNALAKTLEDRRLAVVQGVGYPNPDRSHFRSMEIWETARLDTRPDALDTGWLGRMLDVQPAAFEGGVPAFHVGRGTQPLALRARRAESVSLDSIEDVRLRDGLNRTEQMLGKPASNDTGLLGFVRRSTLAAYAASDRLEAAIAEGAKIENYPTTGLGKRLGLIAQMIRSGFGTRLFYTTQDGYDTHANQRGTHEALLRELADGLGAFDQDIQRAGQAGRVCVLVFSEFGRRVAENASAGTDHGAAAPVFVLGPLQASGLVGDHPSLEDLDDGDLKHHTDFRRVYATLIESWLGLPAAPVLGNGFDPLPLFNERS